MTNAFFPIRHGQTARSVMRLPPVVSRALLVGVAVVSVAISVRSTGSDAPARAGADLTMLLRFMAGLKAVLAVAALGATLWRLAAPVAPTWLATYTISAGLMTAGPGLIWGMEHVALGASMLHGGLAALILLLWRDPATAALLKDLAVSRSVRR